MSSVTIKWVGANGGNWNTASNWSPASVPSTEYAYVCIPAGTNITLNSDVSIQNLEIIGTGTVTLSGNYTVAPSNNVILSQGQELDLTGGANLNSRGMLQLNSGDTDSGTYTLAGGSYEFSNAADISSEQTLVLQNTTYTSQSGLSGSGTVDLAGSTLKLTGGSLSSDLTINFDQVASGGSQNVLDIPNYYQDLKLTNLGYGDVITYGGVDLSLIEIGSSGDFILVAHFGQYYNPSIGTVTLAPGTNPHDFTNSGGSFIYNGPAPCFMQGTMIATPEGAIAVERIVPGTELLLANGQTRMVRWVGHSVVATRFADPLVHLPIRIKAGAIGENMPVRDLLVSPEHAVFIDGVLVQAGALVNGLSVIREETVPERFTYYHIELDSHELLLAEGMAAESFVDNVSRIRFHNWDRRHGVETSIVEMGYPRAKSHRQVPMAVRRAISARAGALQDQPLAA